MDTRIALSGANPDVYGALMRGWQGAEMRIQDVNAQQDRQAFHGALAQRYRNDPTAGVLARSQEGQGMLQQEQEQSKFAYAQNKDAAPVMHSIAQQFSKIPAEERPAAAEHVFRVMRQSNPVVAQAMMEQFTDLSDEGINGVMTGYAAFAPQGSAQMQEFDRLAEVGQFTPEETQHAARVAAGIKARPEPTSTVPQTVGQPHPDENGNMVQTMAAPDGSVYDVPTGTKQFRETPAYVGQAIQKSSDDYNTSMLQAESADRMAAEFSGQFKDAASGAPAAAADAVKGFFGTEDDLSMLRRGARAFLNAETVAALPPGPATDRDIKIMRAGFPNDFANTGQMSKWLEARARLMRAKAHYDGFKSDYLSEKQSTSGMLDAWKSFVKENPVNDEKPKASEPLYLNGRKIVVDEGSNAWVYEDTGEPAQ